MGKPNIKRQDSKGVFSHFESGQRKTYFLNLFLDYVMLCYVRSNKTPNYEYINTYPLKLYFNMPYPPKNHPFQHKINIDRCQI